MHCVAYHWPHPGSNGMAARARLGDASEPDGEDEAAAINAAPRSDALELAAMAERPGAAAAISRPPAHSDSQDELWADTPPAGAGARAAFDAVEPDSASERDSATGPRGAPAAGTQAAAGGPAGAAPRKAGALPTPVAPGCAASDAAGLAPASRVQPSGGESSSEV
jgi:hypothetical protein